MSEEILQEQEKKIPVIEKLGFPKVVFLMGGPTSNKSMVA